jgi:hypothetical protein
MTTERETHPRIDARLDHPGRGLSPFVEARMTVPHGANWLDDASRAQGASASATLDEHGLLKTMLDKWNAVFALPDGSIVKLVEVKAVPVRRRRMSGKYYVEIELKNGSTHGVVEHFSKEEAEKKQAEIIKAVEEAWDGVTPYDVGHEAGRVRGYAEGWSEGLEHGRSEGWSEAHSAGFRIRADNGRSEERQYVLWILFQRREALMNEQQPAGQLPPSRRRYLRDAISVLSDVIRELSPEPTPDSKASVMIAPPDR